MAHVIACDVIGADLDNQDGIERHWHPVFARPAALATWRTTRETLAAYERLEQATDLGCVLVYSDPADVV